MCQLSERGAVKEGARDEEGTIGDVGDRSKAKKFRSFRRSKGKIFRALGHQEGRIGA
jgi:hypothetical protein